MTTEVLPRRESPAGPVAPTARPTVLHVVNRFGVGGSEKQAVEVIRRTDRSRFDVAVATMVPEGPWRGVLEEEGIEILDYPFRGFLRPSGVGHVLALAREIRRRGVDLVHCHDFYSNLFGTVAGRLSATGCRVVTARREFGILRSALQLRAQRLMYALSDLTVVNSEVLGDHLRSEERVPSGRIRVVPNGIDSGAFSPGEPPAGLLRELELPDGAFVVGIVARLGEEKDHATLLRAVARLRSSRPEPPLRLLVVGDGPLRSGLEALARDLGIADVVQFPGSRPDVPDLLRAMDVFVLPSLSEGFPNALLEAMATGLPVVASAVGGSREMVADGETGFLVPPQDPERLAERLALLWDDPHLRSETGRAARSFVADGFSYGRTVRRFEDLYDRLLAG